MSSHKTAAQRANAPRRGEDERRVERRFDLPITVELEDATQLLGRGRVQNMSSSGLWIDRADVRPPVGAEIRVNLMLPGSGSGLALAACVVRHCEGSGFAARFCDLSQSVQDALRVLLEVLAAARSEGACAALWNETPEDALHGRYTWVPGARPKHEE